MAKCCSLTKKGTKCLGKDNLKEISGTGLYLCKYHNPDAPRCSGLTLKGLRCRRQGGFDEAWKNEPWYCDIHVGQANSRQIPQSSSRNDSPQTPPSSSSNVVELARLHKRKCELVKEVTQKCEELKEVSGIMAVLGRDFEQFHL